MATIRKRGSEYHAQIRKHGHRTITKTFTRKADAETWAKQIESKIERGVFVDARAGYPFHPREHRLG